jgi:LacI family transcriptional regulator
MTKAKVRKAAAFLRQTHEAPVMRKRAPVRSGHPISRSRRPRRVALAFSSIGVPHLLEIRRGILRYAQERGNWTLLLNPDVMAISIGQLKGWDGDGVIARLISPEDAEIAARLRLPIVNTSGLLGQARIPRVTVDNRAIGRLAADHLLGRGLRHLAYYGLRQIWYADERGRGFRDAVAAAGGQFFSLDATTSSTSGPAWLGGNEELDDWLSRLPLPVGVFAVSDPRALVLIEACGRVGRRVPDDVAVLGVNNDELLCEFCQPALTSIARNGEQVGYQAATLLNQLMAGRPAPAEEILVPPEGVVERASTQMIAVEDPAVVAAVRFIHDHIHERFGVKTLVQHLDMSRRRLERSFRQTLEMSPHDYISQARVDRARQLLRGPKPLKQVDVAAACGFRDVKHLRQVFRRRGAAPPLR